VAARKPNVGLVGAPVIGDAGVAKHLYNLLRSLEGDIYP
jgi:hypothetical protein